MFCFNLSHLFATAQKIISVFMLVVIATCHLQGSIDTLSSRMSFINHRLIDCSSRILNEKMIEKPIYTKSLSTSSMCMRPTLSTVIVGTCESASNGTIDLIVTGSESYTYLWAPGGQITQDISGLTDGLYSVTVTVNGDPTCTISDAYLVGENAEPFANAGLDKNQCDNGDFIMTAVPAGVGTGLWSFIGPSNGATIVDPSAPSSAITGLTAGTSTTLQWSITNINCQDADQVILTNDIDVTASAGADQEQCNNGDFVMSATNPSVGSGSWSIVGLPHGTSIANTSSNTTTITGLNEGQSVVLRWTVTNGTCFDTDEVTLINNNDINAVAGANQIQCNNGTFILMGNNPVIGSGIWSIIGAPNGAIITTPTLATSTVTNLHVDQSVTLRWTVTNGSCVKMDDVILTNDAQVVANAGIDQANCNSGDFTLAANMPSVGAGSWSIVSAPGGASITNFSSPTSTVTGLLNGQSVTLRWSVFNGTCFETDDITLSNDIEVFAAVGPDQIKCDDGDFTLMANIPFVGVGSWSIIGDANGALITDPLSNISTVTDLKAGHSVTLRWTNDNRGCTAFDQVILTNDAMVLADAGPDQLKCTDEDYIMNANSTPSGSGFWTIIGAPNGATVMDFANPNTTVSGLNINTTATLRWALLNGTCLTTDDIIIGNYADVLSQAGSNQHKCTSGDFILAANDPVIGTGEWSFVGESFDAVITDVSSHTSSVTGLLLTQSVTLRWTVTNFACMMTEDVQLTNHPEVTAMAGPNQAQCDNDIFTLAANDPTEGFGVWSIIGDANGAIIANESAHNSTITGLTAGSSVTLRWFVTNGGCDEFDDVILTNDQDVIAIAGADQAQCNNGTFTLDGNNPNVGSGLWSIIGDAHGATILSANTFNTNVTGLLAGQSATLRWTINNGTCLHFDDVILTNDQDVIAIAGSDQAQCNNGSFTLDGNDSAIGSGIWTIIGDTHGATITSTNTFNTNVTGLLAGQSATLRWTINNGTCLHFDDVILTNDQDVNAIAGSDQAQCNNGTFTLDGNNPIVGSGMWSIIGDAHGATIISANTFNTNVTGLLAGQSATLRWTITNGSCNDFDDVILTNDAEVTSDAGSDQTQCNNGSFTLDGNDSAIGSGIWTIIGDTHGASISVADTHNTSLTGLNADQEVILRWTLTNSTCTDFDEVLLTNDTLAASCPPPISIDTCSAQLDINAAFTTWKSAFIAITNPTGTITYTIDQDGTLTNNAINLNNVTAPDSSGGFVEVNLLVKCQGVSQSCSSTFTVETTAPLMCTAPNSISKPACSNNDDFDMWIGAFSASGGCHRSILYDVSIDGVLQSDLTSISNIMAPLSCGGSVDITLKTTDDRGIPQACSSSYSIASTPDIIVHGPVIMTTDTLISQMAVDSLFDIWINQFGYSGGVCGTTSTTDLSGIHAPEFTGGCLEVNFVVSDKCSADSIMGKFNVPPYLRVPEEIIITGPVVVCPNNDGYIYQVDTIDVSHQVSWRYTGNGAVIINAQNNTIEYGFTSDATSGYVVVDVSDGIRVSTDSLFVAIADPLVCQTFCRGILDISTFMMTDSTMSDTLDYWAEFVITSGGKVLSSREATFNAGLSIELLPDFEVESDGLFEINIDFCDGIGFTDDEIYKKVLEGIIKKNQ